MLRPAVIFTAALALACQVAGQTLLPRQCYMHLTGKNSNELPSVAELVVVEDSLYCDLTISGKNVSLSGNLLKNGEFRLTDMFSEQGPVFSGKFAGSQRIRGTWESQKGGKKIPFELSENYPEGSIAFNVYQAKARKALVKKAGSPAATIALVMLDPAESSNPVISDSVRNFIRNVFFRKKTKAGTPEVMISDMKLEYFDGYVADNQQLYKEMPDASGLNWELLKFMHIIYNAGNSLTFYIISYAYTGGAHGLETEDYFTMNLKTGKPYALDDLMKPGYAPELGRLLTRKLEQMAGISGLQKKLSGEGYFADEIQPNGNFYLNEYGIGFCYNHYEIAPYSFGLTNIFLTFEELKPVLR
jgi:hypothetical protein